MGISSKENCKNKYVAVIPLIILSLCSLVLLVRSFFSFTWSDESFYLTVVHRFWLGERMLQDEWYTTQLSAPLLLPFYSLFYQITGGNEGVYLYFRLLYWIISTSTALITYFKLKKWNTVWSALCCSLVYLFYSRANIGGMSYYNMTLTLILLASVILYCALMEKKTGRMPLFAVGVFLALAVVNTPYLAIPYLVVAAVMMFKKSYHRYWRQIGLVFAGTGITAVLYLIYLFSRITWKELLLNIPYILNEPELQKTNLLLAIPVMFARIAWRYKWTICFYGVLVCYLFYKYFRKKKLSANEKKGICWMNLFVMLLNYFLSSDMIGCVNIAFVLFGIILLLCSRQWETVDRNAVLTFGISGISVVFGFSFSSDTGLDAMTIGFVLLAMAVILLLLQNKQIVMNKQYFYACIAIVVIVIGQSAFLRIGSVYRDAPLAELNTQIRSGPARFLYTTATHEEQYRHLQSDIEKYVRDGDRVLYSKNCFWGYLCTENEYGTPSSWRMGMDSPRLEEYFTLNPEKYPTCVFMLKPGYGSFESSFIQKNEKVDEPNQNERAGFLYEYIVSNDYEEIEAESAIIFRKR